MSDEPIYCIHEGWCPATGEWLNAGDLCDLYGIDQTKAVVWGRDAFSTFAPWIHLFPMHPLRYPKVPPDEPKVFTDSFRRLLRSRDIKADRFRIKIAKLKPKIDRTKKILAVQEENLDALESSLREIMGRPLDIYKIKFKEIPINKGPNS